jgi:hypothetical protein
MMTTFQTGIDAVIRTFGPPEPRDPATSPDYALALAARQRKSPGSCTAARGRPIFPCGRLAHSRQKNGSFVCEICAGQTVAWVSGTSASLDPSGNLVVQDVTNELNPANLGSQVNSIVSSL